MRTDTYISDRERRERASKEAALWLAGLDLGTADPRAFEQWRSTHVDHEIAVARIVGASEAAAANPHQSVEAPKGPGRRDLIRAAAAAGLVLTLGMGGLSGRAYAWSSASSHVGENRMIRLPDGSGARLNTDSTLAWRFGATARTLWIEKGEVALDLRPGIDATLHGPSETAWLSPGRFNARLRGGTLDLLVLRGAATPHSAGVPGGGVPAIASAGEGLLMPAGAPVIRTVTGDEVAATLAWQRGEILFQRETLASAVDEYNRYLDRKIIIADRGLADIAMGGRFTSNDPTAFLRALELGLGIKVSTSETGYLLTR